MQIYYSHTKCIRTVVYYFALQLHVVWQDHLDQLLYGLLNMSASQTTI
jgi:hypothetical protein